MKPKNENQQLHETVSPGFGRTIAWLDNLMVVVCDFTNGPAGKPDPPHSHAHEQITYVAEGELIFFKGNEQARLSRGDVVTIPSGVPHCIQTLSRRVVLVDSFSPVRKEFLK